MQTSAIAQRQTQLVTAKCCPKRRVIGAFNGAQSIE